jgi:hypothetical protein
VQLAVGIVMAIGIVLLAAIRYAGSVADNKADSSVVQSAYSDARAERLALDLRLRNLETMVSSGDARRDEQYKLLEKVDARTQSTEARTARVEALLESLLTRTRQAAVN